MTQTQWTLWKHRETKWTGIEMIWEYLDLIWKQVNWYRKKENLVRMRCTMLSTWISIAQRAVTVALPGDSDWCNWAHDRRVRMIRAAFSPFRQVFFLSISRLCKSLNWLFGRRASYRSIIFHPSSCNPTLGAINIFSYIPIYDTTGSCVVGGALSFGSFWFGFILLYLLVRVW